MIVSGEYYTKKCSTNQQKIRLKKKDIFAKIIDIDEETKQMRLSIKDIYYKTEDDGRIVESRKGFSTLKDMLPIWIDKKLQEYKNNN